ncbi:hypothetical protein P8860_22515 [Bacillus spizizenii]|nr:hypothetical protein [Bacillus spizizenii]MEC0632026.1 hypothetical protein [Bacillus spizizenii]
MSNFLKMIGIGIVGVGAVLFLYLAFGLKLQTIDAEYSISGELHPLRWVYASISLVVSVFFGSVLIGISHLLEGNERVHNKFEQIDEKVKILSDKVKFNR